MFRQLIGLVLLSLAAFGITPAKADTVYLYEGPPVIETYPINTSGMTGRADTLQPTFSATSDRTMYDLQVDVLTNGDLDNFDVVHACFFTLSQATTATERDGLCGYSSANPTTPPTDPDPAHAISMAWTTDGTFRIDGTNQHGLGTSTHSTFETARSIDSSSVTFRAHRVKFQFALSHAAINTSDWATRIVAVSTPTPEPGSGVSTTAQRTEILMDTACTDSYEDQLTSLDSDNSVACGTTDEFGVNFIGGFKSGSERPSQDYGQVNENSSSGTQSAIRTGSYFANDVADLTIAASDFTNGSDTISLVTDGVGSEANSKAITLDCVGGVGSVLLSGAVNDFFTNLAASSGNADSEDATDASTHECQLHYGVGASFANDTYSNTVAIGIKDSDTSTGPSTAAIEITPSP